MRNFAFTIIVVMNWTNLYSQYECFTPNLNISGPDGMNCNPSSCTNEIPIKYLGVHMIFLLSPSGGYNFNEKNDGLGNSSNNGYQRTE